MNCTAGIPEFTCNAKPKNMKPEKFTIEVKTPLDAKYIQDLFYGNGGVNSNGVPNRYGCISDIKYLYFKDGKADGFDSSVLSWPSLPLYKFPSQAEEIVKLFEKEKEPEFKVGDYIWLINVECVHKMDQWSLDYNRRTNFDAIRHATPDEIEAKLIEEAKEKGFVVGAKVNFCDLSYAITGFKLITAENYKSASSANHDYFVDNGLFLSIVAGCSSMPLARCKPWASCPQVTINNYTAKFEPWGLDFNNGCAKIEKELFIDIQKANNRSLVNGNKRITSVKIGTGEFTMTQIKEIADYYNEKAKC